MVIVEFTTVLIGVAMIETHGFVPVFEFAGSCIRIVILGEAIVAPFIGSITLRITFQSPVLLNTELGSTHPLPVTTCPVT
jgi:hypothetical protein